MLQDKCELPPLEEPIALKMRLEEEKTNLTHSLTNLGRDSLLKQSILLYEDSNPSFYRRMTGHESVKKLTKEAT